MCEIAGIVGGESEIKGEILKTMGKSMIHRGPDDEGIYLSKDQKTDLVSRRLVIIDLSPAGYQPMTNEDETIWIVYNGTNYIVFRLSNVYGSITGPIILCPLW
ncbi:MAG: hypothetical protein IBV53_07010 [Candidatus Atribacteria bacterium]